MRASDRELEVMWEDVFRAMGEARKPYRESDSESCVEPEALCPSCDEIHTLSSSQARSLVLASFADGHVYRAFSQRLKCAALDSRQGREDHLR